MIESIYYRRRHFSLIPSPTSDHLYHNIFAADSFSLVIGENGAGKTSLLREIAWAFVNSKRSNAAVKFKGEVKGGSSKRSYGLIYYTPIPYPVRLPENNSGFVNATPNLSRKGGAQIDINHYINISKMLSMPAKPLVVIRYNPSRVLSALVREMVDAHSKGQLGYVDAEFDLILKKFSSSSSKILDLLAESPVSYMERPYGERENSEWHMVEDLLRNLDQFLRAKLKNEMIPMLSAFDAFLTQVKTTRILARYFLGHFCGISMPAAKNNSAANFKEKLIDLINSKIEVFKSTKGWRYERSADEVRAEAPINKNAYLLKLASAANQQLVDVVWENFSSGQLGLLYQFSSIDRAAQELRENGLKDILLLIDEGDIYLHSAWQRRYIEILNILMKNLKEKFDTVQVILTSHSLSLVTDVPRQCIHRLDAHNEKSDGSIVGFAAPLQDVINQSFQTGSIGSFAEGILTRTASSLRAGQGNKFDDFVISIVDDPIIKRELMRLRGLGRTN